MGLRGKRIVICWTAMFLLYGAAFGQIDPDKRQLLQLGYNASFQGHAPLAGYAFYYLNRPEFYRDDLTLRMAVAPVYFDSELGIAHALGPHTDVGIGISGGGFADSYNEVRGGRYFTHESFDGHGGGASASIYHLFNPNQRIPLYAVLRGGMYYTVFDDTKDTSEHFHLPADHPSANFRTGLRFGGKEPVLFPSVAMELSIWAESHNRADAGSYGYNRDRDLNTSTELFYAHAYLAYTFDRGDNLSVSVTAGDSVNSDRLSAYRLGGVLPLVAEYPLVIPGYYFQELSADRFVLFNGRYAVTLDEGKHWQAVVMAATALVDYTDGMGQAGNWNSGVGGGLAYRSENELWKVALTYGYGIDAIRDRHRGAHVVGLMIQFDFQKWLYKQRSKPFRWEIW